MAEHESVGLEALEDAAQITVAAVVGAGSGPTFAEYGASGLTGYIVPMLLLTLITLYAIKLFVHRQMNTGGR